MEKNKKKSYFLTKKRITKRSMIVFLVIVLGLAVLGLVLFSLQITDVRGYKQKAAQSQLEDAVVPAQRGAIYDKNMNIIAQSSKVWKVFIDPENFTEENTQPIINMLVETLGADAAALQESITKGKETGNRYIVIKEDVNFDEKENMLKKREEIKGGYLCIGVQEDTKRFYPNGTMASSVIGFINNDGAGVTGVESSYNSDLTGIAGRSIGAVDALKSRIPESGGTIIAPEDGSSLVLTIDSVIQGYLDAALTEGVKKEKATAGYAMVMDVKTGAVLAMSSSPSYNLNKPYTLVNETRKKEIEKIKDEAKKIEATNDALFEQWNNGCVRFAYDPGSVFKVVTAAAGLEEGVVKVNDTLNCPGYIMVGDRRINCHLHSGHGTQTFTQGLMNSCNPWFVTVGQRLGIDSFMKYFEAFGFTESSGIDLPAEIQPRAGLNYHNRETMSIGDLASSSFGQTFQSTPLQMLTAMAAIGNGGKLMEPYLVAAKLDTEGNTVWEHTPYVRRQVISQEVAQQTTQMMEAVVNGGGGSNAYVTGYHVAGKTGTSEKLGTEEKNYIASFACIAPSYDPEIAIIVVVDEPRAGRINGSAISAPIAGVVAEKTLKYLNVEPRYTDSELAVLNDLAPTVLNLNVNEAKTIVEKKGLAVMVVGNGKKVTRQVPQSGGLLPKNGIVILYTEKDSSKKVKVPDFTGMTVTQARASAHQLGINIQISGNFKGAGDSTAYKQSVKATSEIELGTTVTVHFSSANTGNDLAT